MKELKDLNLMDRFLFSEAMEIPQNMTDVLDIILGKDIVLRHLPQAEKEEKTSPLYRFAKLDVWAQDTDDSVYDTEVQGKNTGNLPHRSRYYAALIDAKLLPPGETDFNAMGDSYIILITPFDLFGYGRYQYTFRMTCQEEPTLALEDGSTRIFLNTHGTNPEDVSPELVELLNYIENSTEATANACKSPRIKNLHKRVQQLKANEEVTVKYMNRWEELILERKESYANGEQGKLKEQIRKKLAKGKPLETIAEELEEDDLSVIRDLAEEIKSEAKAKP